MLLAAIPVVAVIKYYYEDHFALEAVASLLLALGVSN
tara:strand:+ start:418 stop:528 length:111 start_codon:yes stop_codon:yes gene_type:complete